MNGEDSEVTKLVASIKGEASTEAVSRGASPKSERKADSDYEGHESDVTQYSSEEEKSEKPVLDAETPRRRSTRVRKQARIEE